MNEMVQEWCEMNEMVQEWCEMNEMVWNGVRAYANLFDGLKH